MIGLNDAKTHMRVTHSRDDAYIVDLELAVVAHLEGRLKVFLGLEEQVTRYVVGGGLERLWLPDLATLDATFEVEERVYAGSDGTVLTATDGNGYLIRPYNLVPTKTGCLLRRSGYVWWAGYEYAVTFTRGWPQPVSPNDTADLSVPYEIRRAGLFLMAWWYSQRTPAAPGTSPRGGPEGQVAPEVDNHLRRILGRWQKGPVRGA